MTGAPEAHRAARTGAWIVVLLLLLGYSLNEAREDFPYQYAFDLYHPWAISLARGDAAAPSNPYTQTAAYGAFAGGVAERSASRALQAAGRFWQGRNPQTRFEPTGTPLYYAALSVLPRDFDRAHELMSVLQFASLGAAVVILGRLRRWRWLACLCAAALAWAAFNPFTQDVKFANAASLQTACVAVLVALALRHSWERSPAIDRGYLAMLALLVLFKPNTALIAAGLVLHYAGSRGMRRFTIGLLVAALAAAIAGGLAAASFGQPGIWLDWYRYVNGANGGTLLYPAADGNLSLVKMLSERAPLHGVAFYSAMAALVFALLLFAGASAMGRDSAGLRARMAALLEDPWLLASAAILATFLVAPLVWPHYWVLLVIPIMRFAAWERRIDASTVLVLAAFVALSRWPLQWLVENAPAAIYIFMVFSWMPLLPALALQLARAQRSFCGRPSAIS